jgi:hypothetical protein
MDNIKMDLPEMGLGDMAWIDLTQDRDRWPTLVNVVMNLRFHKIRGISSLFEDLWALHKQFGCISLVGWLVGWYLSVWLVGICRFGWLVSVGLVGCLVG